MRVNSVREIVDLWEAGAVSRGMVVALAIDMAGVQGVDSVVNGLSPELRGMFVDWIRENCQEGAIFAYVKGPEYESPIPESTLAAIREWMVRNPA